MHVAIPEIGLLGTNGIVGGGIPIATGAAYGLQTEGRDDVTVCFFGEGAAATGVFGEALNIAALWRLPLVFICENNQYVELTPQSLHVAGEIWRRGEALRHARRPGRRQRRRRGRRARSADAVARARGGRRPDADRGRHLPLVRPLRRRQAPPTATRRRSSEWRGARPADQRARRLDAGRGRRRRRRGRGGDRRGARVRAARARSPGPDALAIDHYARRHESTATTHRHRDALAEVLAGRQPGAASRRWSATSASCSSARTSGGPAAPTASRAGCSTRFGELRVRDTPISEAVLVGLGVGGARRRPAPDRRDHVLRLRDDRDGPDRQPGGEVPLLLGRLDAARRSARCAAPAGPTARSTRRTSRRGSAPCPA